MATLKNFRNSTLEVSGLERDGVCWFMLFSVAQTLGKTEEDLLNILIEFAPDQIIGLNKNYVFGCKYNNSFEMTNFVSEAGLIEIINRIKQTEKVLKFGWWIESFVVKKLLNKI